jgi:hypothetical protein
MSDPTGCSERPRLWDVFDDAGRKWLEEVVRAFNDGGYSEMVAAFLADEAGAIDE